MLSSERVGSLTSGSGIVGIVRIVGVSSVLVISNSFPVANVIKLFMDVSYKFL
jgi:hypothetical protein